MLTARSGCRCPLHLGQGRGLAPGKGQGPRRTRPGRQPRRCRPSSAALVSTARFGSARGREHAHHDAAGSRGNARIGRVAEAPSRSFRPEARGPSRGSAPRRALANRAQPWGMRKHSLARVLDTSACSGPVSVSPAG